MRIGDGSRERRIIRKELRCINLKGSVMNACVEKIYISDIERTNRSFHSFHSIGFSENRPKTTFANWNEFDQKKKKKINYFYYSIPESDIIM